MLVALCFLKLLFSLMTMIGVVGGGWYRFAEFVNIEGGVEVAVNGMGEGNCKESLNLLALSFVVFVMLYDVGVLIWDFYFEICDWRRIKWVRKGV